MFLRFIYINKQRVSQRHRPMRRGAVILILGGRPCCAHEYLLAAQHRTAALHVEGRLSHAARLWARLDLGMPVKVGVLGASVAMSGGCQREHQPHVRCADYDGVSSQKRWAYGGRLKGRMRGFALQVLDWFNETWPNRAHRVYNGASDGNPAAVLEKCMLSALPSDADVILLEFGSARSDPFSVERIMRRLLQLPSQPLLVLVNVREWCRCGNAPMPQRLGARGRREGPTSQPGARACSWSGRDERMVVRMFSRWEGPEDDFAQLCRHYSQTCVSLRNGLFHPVMRAQPGFSVTEVAADCVHPSRGSKGHRYLGDMVVHALASSLSRYRAASSPAANATAQRFILPAPFHETNRACAVDSQPVWRCYSFEVSPSARLQNDRVLNGRFAPEPSEAGAPPPAPACAALADCILSGRAQLDSQCVRTYGHWQFCSRAFNALRARKPGLVAFRAGATMRVYVDAQVGMVARQDAAGLTHGGVPSCSSPTHAHPTAAACALISLAYLTSYEQMGIVRVGCEGGCSCSPQDIDAHVTDPSRNVSVVREKVFRATPAPDCVLRFTILHKTSSAGHKWKLLRVSVGSTQTAGSTLVGGGERAVDGSESCAERQPRYRGWINMRARSHTSDAR